MCKRICPKNERPAKAYGLLKIQKDFVVLSKFQPIADTESSAFLFVGHCFSKILQSLTINDYNIKDSFNAVIRIKNIPQERFDKGYWFLSFYVDSLFTNVLLLTNTDKKKYYAQTYKKHL